MDYRKLTVEQQQSLLERALLQIEADHFLATALREKGDAMTDDEEAAVAGLEKRHASVSAELDALPVAEIADPAPGDIKPAGDKS